MRKRGAIEIQFNWILVLAAGAVIIIMLMSFTSKQQEIHDFSTDILAANSLSSIFSSYASAGISAVVEMPKSRIDFTCNSFSVDGISKNLDVLDFFSPSTLETDKLNLWALGWDMPYRITNFIYVTSPDVRYIFIGNSDFAREVFEKVRGKIRADGFTNIQAVEDENDAIIRLVFFDHDPEMPESLKTGENTITSLKIEGDKNSGVIEFFDLVDGKFEPRGKSYYFREASLLGAVFSDNAGTYKCNMEKGFNKLKIISQIYNKKVNNIIEQYSNIEENKVCRDFYQNNLLLILDSISYLSSSNFQSSDYEGIIEAANKIEKINSEADALSCITIY